MAQSSFPFEGIDTTETQYSQLFRTFQDSVNGTYGGTELTVSVGTGLAVDVALGQAMVRGHFYVSTATESLSLTTADATNPRLDLVVLRLDPVANSIVLAVKDGTPAGSPTAPALVQTDAGTYEIALASVLVPATSGVPTTITDKRQFMGSRISLWSDDTRPTTASRTLVSILRAALLRVTTLLWQAGVRLAAAAVLRFRLRHLPARHLKMVICGGIRSTVNFMFITTMGLALSGLRRLARL